MTIPRPQPGDYADYLGAYIAQVPDRPILDTLAAQIDGTAALLSAAGEELGDHRYEPGKWSVKEVVAHLSDTERVFAYRALCFGRGDTTPLPGFEQDDWIPFASCRNRTLADLVAELRKVRAATLALFGGFPAEAWQRRGTAAEAEILVGAFPWVIAGHELHHREVLRDRYGL